MERYWEANGASSAPTQPSQTNGTYPTDGDPSSGTPASIPGAWWFHMISEEIRSVIIAAGMTPDFTNLNQLKSAIVSLAASNSFSLIQIQQLIEQYSNQAVQLTGSANSFSGSLTPAVTSNSAIGSSITVYFPSAITGAATINIGGGVTDLVDAQGNPFSSTNTVPAGSSIIQYNGTISKFQLLGVGVIDQVARNTANEALTAATAGEIKMWPTATAPSGYLMCAGAAVSRTTYAALFAVIGITFGAGDGSTTFNLPNYVDRMPIGAGTIANIASTGGSKDAIVVSHNHTATVSDPQHSHGASSSVSDPGHFHTISNQSADESGSGKVSVGQSPPEGINPYTDSATTGISVATNINNASTGISVTNQATGSSGTNANLPPYLGINFIIKT